MSKSRWLIAAIKAAEEAELTLPWSRGARRAQRKAAARARVRAD